MGTLRPEYIPFGYMEPVEDRSPNPINRRCLQVPLWRVNSRSIRYLGARVCAEVWGLGA